MSEFTVDTFLDFNRRTSAAIVWHPLDVTEHRGFGLIAKGCKCTCRHTKIHWMKLCLILMVLCISVRTSAQCISRYIARPIDGYSCHISVFRNISNIQFQQCIHACLGSKFCWTLSYDNAGKHCLLAEEPCVSAERRDGFCMMILSTSPSQQCLHWMPFSGICGNKHGYPERAVQTPMRNNRVATVARSTGASHPSS